MNLPDNHKRVSQQQQHPVPTQRSAAVLLAEQEALAIDWADEKLDLQAAFAKIRNVLAARNANANAVLQALSGGGSGSVGANSTNEGGTADATALGAANTTNDSSNVLGVSDGAKITDSLSHMPIGSASPIGIYYDLPFRFL